MYQFCNLELIYRKIVSGAFFIYYLREESQISCMDTLWKLMCRIPFLGHNDLDLCPSFKNNLVWGISSILFVAIPNLVC